MSVEHCYTSTTDLTERIRTGELSPVELVDASQLGRLARDECVGGASVASAAEQANGEARPVSAGGAERAKDD